MPRIKGPKKRKGRSLGAPEDTNRFRAAYKKSVKIMQDAIGISGGDAVFPGNQMGNGPIKLDNPSPPEREARAKGQTTPINQGLDMEGVLQDISWSPQPGPQTALLMCPVEDIFFGGARGGGKSDALLGDWLMHRERYGGNCRGILFRRTYTELEELIQRSLMIYPATGAQYSKAEHTWYWPDGSILRMRYLEADEDAARYQGFNFCVAVGTPVLMADGSWKPIESIRVGDFVMTLEGPRDVTLTVDPYAAPCVVARVYDDSGHYVGEQRHPEWHPILALDGLSEQLDPRIPHTLPRVDLSSIRQTGTPQGSWERGGPDAPGWISWSGATGSGYTGSSHEPPGRPQPQELTAPVVLHAPTLRLIRERSDTSRAEPIESCSRRKFSEHWSETFRGWRHSPSDPPPPSECVQSRADLLSSSPTDGPACVPPATRTFQDSPGYCSPDHGPCGGPPPRLPEIDQAIALPPADAGQSTQVSPPDGAGTTPKHNRPNHVSYRHLYSGEERHLSEAVEPGIAILSPCGDLLVADITVRDANHYITSVGIINAQTWMGVDELGAFPTSRPIDMLWATLRSATGIPCVRRSTGNPGGPGTQWIKERYIDPSEPWVPFRWAPIKDRPDLTLESVFIPSKLEDNVRLMTADPRYEMRLAAINDPEMFKAWREGDWTVLAGRYFSTFKEETCVMDPVHLPPWLPRWISVDWGFAHNSAVYWGCYDGQRIYIYDEMVVDEKTPVDLARMIVRRTALNSPNSKIAKLVLSPDAYNRRSSQKTIATEMAAILPWRMEQADNDRIGGWNLMRQMFAYEQLKVFNVCPNLIKKLKVAQRDPKRPEDVMKHKGDDEIDSARYLVKTGDMRIDVPEDIIVEDAIRKYVDAGEYMNAFVERLRLKDALRKKNKPRRIGGLW